MLKPARKLVTAATIGSILFTSAAVFARPLTAKTPSNVCVDSIFCDNFTGTTKFKDQTAKADWHRYEFDNDNATNYINLESKDSLRLELDEDATANSYANADISTSQINNSNGVFLFGENTRVDVRMKYDANMNSDFNNPGSAKGSAGLLFWNYFLTEVDPELKDLDKVRDSFGFIWQDGAGVPLKGFYASGIAQGQYSPIVFLPQIDISEYHVYSLERRHESIRYFIDGTLVKEVLLNQPGELTLPASAKLSVDIWVDNATYVLDFNTFHVDLDFNDITQKQAVEVDYVKVSAL